MELNSQYNTGAWKETIHNGINAEKVCCCCKTQADQPSEITNCSGLRQVSLVLITLNESPHFSLKELECVSVMLSIAANG